MSIDLNRWIAGALCAVAFGLTGCGASSGDAAGDSSLKPRQIDSVHSQPHGQPSQSSASTADLDSIIERGELRVLTLHGAANHTTSHPLEQERLLIEQFAHAVGIRVNYIEADNQQALFELLQEGQGDLVAANLPQSGQESEQVSFSQPISHRRLVIVGRKGQPEFATPSDFSGHQLALSSDDRYLHQANSLYEQQPLLELLLLPEESSAEQNLELVRQGEVELTLVDAALLSHNRLWQQQLKVLYTLESAQPHAIAVRASNPELLSAFNSHLTQQRLTQNEHEIAFGDLPAIRQRGTLRVLTRNNGANYFLWRGRQMGFEYELVQRFASREKLELEVVVVPNNAALLPMLLAGKGDIALGFLARDERFAGQGIDYSEPYHYATPMLVGRSDEEPLESLQQLKGRTLVVRASSQHWTLLEPLAAEYGFKLQAAPEEMESEDLLGAVAEGRFDLSVVDNHLLKQQRLLRTDIQGLLPIGELTAQRWAVRSNTPQLLAAIDSYHTKSYKKTFYNLLIGKYFTSKKRVLAYSSGRIDGDEAGKFSGYDEQIRRQASRYGFDWRLVVAQVYQESRFNPDARSSAGAVGLMQIMPDTAKLVGVADRNDPRDSIRGGLKYMAWLRGKFEENLSIEDRTWFALASYNAGLGHVLDARRLAAEQGLDPDRWFDNVEKAMLLLSERKYARQARYGYVRGQEPVNYVREIRNRYKAYTLLTAWDHPHNS